MWAYYYAPLYDGPMSDEVNPETEEVFPGGNTREPGKDTGSGPEYAITKPVGMVVLFYDDAETRCVVKLRATSAPLQGWVGKAPAEVQADYLELLGVE